jgi:branched-chain amino acid aminotransferase
MIAFINNQFIEEEKVTLGITDLSIQRGYGVFDFFRAGNNIPLFIDNHLNRFFNSAAMLRLQVPHSKEEIKDIISEMIKRNKMPESSFRLVLTGGYSPDYYELSSPNFIIIQQPVQMSGKEKFDQGSKIILYEYMRDLPQAKSINYLMGVYLQHELQQQKADDVLYYKDGHVLEFPRSNVFAVSKNGTVITPADNVLHGVTRMKVLEIAREKYAVEERAVTVDELKDAAEVFLTNTTKRLQPVLSIDGKTVGNGKPGEITTSLYKSFLQMEKTLITV